MCNSKANPGILCTFQEELTRAVAKLEETKHKLAALKVQGDNKQGTPILVPTLGNKNATAEKVRDKQRELQDLEATHKELMVCLELQTIF